MECIKCGKPIPEGELFCTECSFNLTAEALEQTQTGRYPAADGRMQSPKPVKKQPAPAAGNTAAAKGRKGNSKTAFTVVCLLLAVCVGLLIWQQTGIQLEKNKLRVRAEDLDIMEWELEELRKQVDELTVELETAEQTIAAKELALQEVESALNGSESTMNQTQYDMAKQKLELERLKSEMVTREAEMEALETQLTDAEAKLEEAETYREKADFLDGHVVFVEDNRTGYYHTYSCRDFPKSKFWAYSRKLAESSGFKACPVCEGKP